MSLNIHFVVKFINDTELANKKPKYFADLTSGMAAYFLLAPTGETIIGFNHAEVYGNFFAWQMLISGFNTDIKIRKCTWTTEWTECRTL